jgi:predicted DNA-binding protein
MKKSVSYRFDQETIAIINKISKLENRSRSNAVENIILNYWRNTEDCQHKRTKKVKKGTRKQDGKTITIYEIICLDCQESWNVEE